MTVEDIVDLVPIAEIGNIEKQEGYPHRVILVYIFTLRYYKNNWVIGTLMPRALNDILKELDTVYDPQKDIYNSQLALLPGQQQAELGGLEAAKTDSFSQITQGANRRGVAFGGIPLEEQGRYLGQSYLPAVANLKGRFAGQKSDLQLRLAELAGKQRTEARDIYDREWAREQTEIANRAASSGGGGGGGGFTFGGGEQSTAPGVQTNVSIKPQDQLLYNQMFIKSDGSRWSDEDLARDYNQTLISARNGNARDVRKIEMYSAEMGWPMPSGLFVRKPSTSGTRTTLPVSTINTSWR